MNVNPQVWMEWVKHAPGLLAVLIVIWFFLKYLRDYQATLAARHVAYFEQLENMNKSTNAALSEVTTATTRLYTLLDHHLQKADK